MEYRLKIKEEVKPVEVEAKEPGTLRAILEDKAFDVGFAMVNGHQIHLNVDGQRVNAYVFAKGPEKFIAIRGKTYHVQDADALERSVARKTGPKADPTEVTPPMPAVVVSVGVAPGDKVAKGQAVVVVSAMKMETTLAAPYDGTVTQVHVAQGDKVMPGQILVDIEKAPEE